MGGGGAGHRVIRIVADDDLEYFRRVFDGARDRSGDIGEETQRKNACAAGEPHGGPNPDQRLVR